MQMPYSVSQSNHFSCVFRLVGHVDDFMSLYNGTVFVVSVINISLMLYLLIWESRVYEVRGVCVGACVRVCARWCGVCDKILWG